MTTRYLGAGLDLGNTVVANVASPSVATDAANKGYVDNLVAGLSWKDEVRAASTAALTLATGFASGQVVDGVTLATNDRILVKNQATQTENGIYTVGAGAPTRATDADATAELNNATVFVRLGTVNAGLSYTQTTDNPTIGSSNIVFSQFNAGTVYTASLGVVKSGNDFRLDTVAAGNGLTLTSGALDVVTADTSLTVAANAISVNPAASGGLTVSSGLKVDSTVARIFRQVATNANTTSVTVTHSLNNKGVITSVIVDSTGELVECDQTNTANTCVFLFGTAPALNTLTFTIVG